MELESGRLEHHVRVEDHAALADERDSLARRLRETDDEAGRLRKLLDAEREQVGIHRSECMLSVTGEEPQVACCCCGDSACVVQLDTFIHVPADKSYTCL